MRGGGVCQPGLACADGVVNGKKSFSEQNFPWPPSGVANLEVVRPKTDVPHGVKRAGYIQTFGTSAQKVLFHGRVLLELGKIARNDGGFSNTVPSSVVKITHTSTNALVRTRV